MVVYRFRDFLWVHLKKTCLTLQGLFLSGKDGEYRSKQSTNFTSVRLFDPFASLSSTKIDIFIKKVSQNSFLTKKIVHDFSLARFRANFFIVHDFFLISNPDRNYMAPDRKGSMTNEIQKVIESPSS